MPSKKTSTKKRAPSAATTETKVTRIKATDKKPAKSTASKSIAKKPQKAVAAAKAVESKKEPKEKKQNWFSRLMGYFAGSWYELRQVHWPDRKNSWAMTVALIIFTLIFVGIILLLDALFQYLFSLALGK